MPSPTAKPYLAFDLGAESGRAVLGRLQSDILSIEEVHRFPNEPVGYGGSLHWDAPRLWLEMRRALAKLHDVPLTSMGVDAWGVDYALLGERGELLQNPYHYRDRRTAGVMEEVFHKIGNDRVDQDRIGKEKTGKEEIYRATGIQFMSINTLYQLYAAQRDTPELLKSARRLVMVPDLFHYWLTGNAVCELTNATTTQMVDPNKRNWSTDLMQRLNLPSQLPAPIAEAGSILGALLPELADGTALAGTKVVLPACHDTGSAVAAITARDGTAFLSSGTWSLLGTELDSPVISSDALRLNFTNEGGVDGTTRLLKNIMGLWMLQCCRRSWVAHNHEHNHDYRDLMELASKETSFRHLIDPDDESFLRPHDMPAAIDEFCRRTQQDTPRNPGAYVRAILESMAFKYRLVLKNLEQVSGTRITQIRVIGGGSKNHFLNQLTADATGRCVLAGPAEATAGGNLSVQILATGEASSLKEVRAIVDRSFPTEVFNPRETDKWDQHAERFEHYCEIIYA